MTFTSNYEMVRMGASHSREEERDAGLKPMCPVCFESTPPPDFVRVCGHAFHSRCHLKWCERNVACPLCRDDFVLRVTGGSQSNVWAAVKTFVKGGARRGQRKA